MHPQYCVRTAPPLSFGPREGPGSIADPSQGQGCGSFADTLVDGSEPASVTDRQACQHSPSRPRSMIDALQNGLLVDAEDAKAPAPLHGEKRACGVKAEPHRAPDAALPH